MEFSPNNNIIKLCLQGMDMEGKGKPEEASGLFLQAWSEATNDFEKFTAAYYVARHQKDVSGKLEWLKTALHSLHIDRATCFLQKAGAANFPYRDSHALHKVIRHSEPYHYCP